MVGLIPFFAVLPLERRALEHLPRLQAMVDAYLKARPHIDFPHDRRASDRRDRAILALPSREQLLRVLTHLLDEKSLLAPTGIRSLSKRHQIEPFILRTPLGEYRVEYAPDDSRTKAFGINSNWRGPVWFPLNYLLVEALRRYHDFYGDTVRVECPTGLGCFHEPPGSGDRDRTPARLHVPGRSAAGGGRATATIRATAPTRISRISCSSTNISPATPDAGSARRIRPGGRRWRCAASRMWRREGGP